MQIYLMLGLNILTIKYKYLDFIAQLVEHYTFNVGVTSSSLVEVTIKKIIMNLQQTTIFDIILYIVMVLFIIGVLIGACIQNDILILISTIFIFVILFIFLIINTFRFIKYGRRK